MENIFAKAFETASQDSHAQKINSKTIIDISTKKEKNTPFQKSFSEVNKVIPNRQPVTNIDFDAYNSVRKIDRKVNELL